ncbi:MAG TPA: hypothetical protein VKR31_00950 [Rhizomicrobium sp.]|nr:hypothetical protein [Rhizomicrobium sp.]
MSILTYFESLGVDLAAEAAKVGIELEHLGQKEIGTAVADFDSLAKVGIPFAVQAIKDQIPQVISGKEKFSAAVTVVWEKLQAQFGPVVQQDVESIVQDTWNGLKSIASNL